MANWFHRLMNPHCTACREEALENKQCNSCDELRALLNIEKREKQQLLDRILAVPKPEPEKVHEVNLDDIARGTMSWRVRQQMLEQEDRAKAAILRKQRDEEIEMARKSTEELEQEMEIS